MNKTLNLKDLLTAHDFCADLLDTKRAFSYNEAMQLARCTCPPARNVGFQLLKSTLIASDGNLQKHGVRL